MWKILFTAVIALLALAGGTEAAQTPVSITCAPVASLTTVTAVANASENGVVIHGHR